MKQKFAWWPVTMTSGRRIWFRNYWLYTSLLALLLWSHVAMAQDSVRQVMRESLCMDSDSLEDVLMQFDEIPVARGMSVYPEQSSLVIFTNVVSGTYTVAIRVSANNYCVIAAGSGFESIPTDVLKKFNENRQKNKL